MLYKLSLGLTNLLCRGIDITTDEREVYTYAFEMIISTGSSFLTILVISIVYGSIVGAILFLVSFLSLRRYTGGNHANTFLGCYLTTVSVYAVALIVVKTLPTAALGYLSFFISLIGLILIWLYAPKGHPNREITESEYPIFKKYSRMMSSLMFLAVVIGLIFFMRYINIFACLSFAILYVGIFLLGKPQNTLE